MKITLSILLSIFCLTVFGQTANPSGKNLRQVTAEDALARKWVGLEADKIYDKLVTIRRDIHEHPELAGNEKRTQQFIKQYLIGLGLKVDTGIYVCIAL